VDARRRRPQIAAGVGIFSDRMPERWIWARAAGDTIDRALLTGALRNKSRSPGRTLIATGAVAGASLPTSRTGCGRKRFGSETNTGS
jgi:hypothetical protein